MITFEYEKTKYSSENEKEVWDFVKTWTEKNKKEYDRYVKSQNHSHPEELKHLNIIDFYLEHTCES